MVLKKHTLAQTADSRKHSKTRHNPTWDMRFIYNLAPQKMQLNFCVSGN